MLNTVTVSKTPNISALSKTTLSDTHHPLSIAPPVKKITPAAPESSGCCSSTVKAVELDITETALLVVKFSGAIEFIATLLDETVEVIGVFVPEAEKAEPILNNIAKVAHIIHGVAAIADSPLLPGSKIAVLQQMLYSVATSFITLRASSSAAAFKLHLEVTIESMQNLTNFINANVPASSAQFTVANKYLQQLKDQLTALSDKFGAAEGLVAGRASAAAGTGFFASGVLPPPIPAAQADGAINTSATALRK